MNPLRKLLGVCAAVILAAGCGGGEVRGSPGGEVRISPNTATADHALAVPGNQVDFAAFQSCPTFGTCAEEIPTTWTFSDRSNIQTDPGCDSGGNACRVTCLAAATVTVTATHKGTGNKATAMLTCQ